MPLVGPDPHAGDGLLTYWTHGPVAPWQTPEWIMQMRRSLRPNQFLRMIENRFVTTEAQFIPMDWWDRCVDPNASPVAADRLLAIYVGVDASVKRDSTALVWCTWDRKLKKVRLVIYQPSAPEPLDFESTVEATLRDLRKRFRVRKVLFDPYQMAAIAQRLQRERLPMEEYPQTTSNLTQSSQNLYELIEAGSGPVMSRRPTEVLFRSRRPSVD